jgi:beta-mannosidase
VIERRALPIHVSSPKPGRLRTFALVQKPDRWGKSFYFSANGVPFFAKGANWIPADSLPSRVTPAKYEHLLHAAVEANMNMLRVWGGGIYEAPEFYYRAGLPFDPGGRMC